ncbi:MAG: flavin reductase family protein, partial [Lachnospiraceae bacterium]|nr:flavin reductase family protein [Lachnospiraceae bacterium]
SKLFAYEKGDDGAPVITKAPLSLVCTVEDIYNTPGFESFICTIDNTYVEEEHLNADGKVNYHTLKPVLFEFPTYEYLKTGDVLGKCLSFKENTEE